MGQPILLVAGMHRSGTSALARVMNLRGGALPADLLAPAPDNPTGFWEPREAVRLNDRVLETLKLRWDDPTPLPPGAWPPVLEGPLAAEVAGWLAAQVAEAAGRPLVLKDPRLGRTLPLWIAAAREQGLEPVVAHILRNPLEVGASLKARNKMSPAVWQHLWLVHVLETERAARGLPRVRLTYPGLLDDPIGATARLAALCGLPAEPDAETAEACRGFVDRGIRHHRETDETLARARGVGPLVKAAWTTLTGRAAAQCTAGATVDGLYEGLLQAWDTMRPAWRRQDMAGKVRGATAASGAAQDPTEGMDDTMRRIVLHYHLFKNAGTSVDHLLRTSYGTSWVEMEGPNNEEWGPDEIAAFLDANPNVKALSSHTALLPLPRVDGAEILPILFLREPIRRALSVYQFEHRQAADTDGARAAKKYSLTDYVKWRLDRPRDRAIRNFQTYRLGMRGRGDDREELTRAFDTLLALPFVGIVEDFNGSVRRLAALGAIDLDATKSLPHENRSERTQADDEVLHLLTEANKDDTVLYEFARHYHRIKSVA